MSTLLTKYQFLWKKPKAEEEVLHDKPLPDETFAWLQDYLYTEFANLGERPFQSLPPLLSSQQTAFDNYNFDDYLPLLQAIVQHTVFPLVPPTALRNLNTKALVVKACQHLVFHSVYIHHLIIALQQNTDVYQFRCKLINFLQPIFSWHLPDWEPYYGSLFDQRHPKNYKHLKDVPSGVYEDLDAEDKELVDNSRSAELSVTFFAHEEASSRQARIQKSRALQKMHNKVLGVLDSVFTTDGLGAFKAKDTDDNTELVVIPELYNAYDGFRKVCVSSLLISRVCLIRACTQHLLHTFVTQVGKYSRPTEDLQAAFDNQALKEELTKGYIKFEPAKKATNTQVAKFTAPFSQAQVEEGYFSLHPDLPVVAMDFEHQQKKARPFKRPYTAQIVSISSVKPAPIKLDDPALERFSSEEANDGSECLLSLSSLPLFTYTSHPDEPPSKKRKIDKEHQSAQSVSLSFLIFFA